MKMIRRPDRQRPHRPSDSCPENCVPISEHPFLPRIYAFAGLLEAQRPSKLLGLDAVSLIAYAAVESRELVKRLKVLDGDDCNETRFSVAEGCARVSVILMELAMATGGLRVGAASDE